MMPTDSGPEGRSVPSVNERGLKKSRLVQWLIVVLIMIVVGGGVAWLLHSLRQAWHATATPSEPPATATPRPRQFDWSQLAPPAPPAPPTPAPALNPNPAPAAQPASAPAASATPPDKMMLTSAVERTSTATVGTPAAAATVSASAGQGDSGGALSPLLGSTKTVRARANWLGDRNFILAKGTAFDCVLITKLVSTVSGIVTCTVPRNVYSDNGKVLLIERGSTVTGEYRSDQLQLGMERIFVLWDRIKTIDGVVITLDSPGTGPLGEGGVGGYVDNHWGERIGAAVLLSLVQDAVAYKTAQETATNGTSVVMLPNTTQQSQTLAGKILDKTINIPPTLSRNQGDKVMVMVARDLDFSSVYALRAQ